MTEYYFMEEVEEVPGGWLTKECDYFSESEINYCPECGKLLIPEEA